MNGLRQGQYWDDWLIMVLDSLVDSSVWALLGPVQCVHNWNLVLVGIVNLFALTWQWLQHDWNCPQFPNGCLRFKHHGQACMEFKRLAECDIVLSSLWFGWSRSHSRFANFLVVLSWKVLSLAQNHSIYTQLFCILHAISVSDSVELSFKKVQCIGPHWSSSWDSLSMYHGWKCMNARFGGSIWRISLHNLCSVG